MQLRACTTKIWSAVAAQRRHRFLSVTLLPKAAWCFASLRTPYAVAAAALGSSVFLCGWTELLRLRSFRSAKLPLPGASRNTRRTLGDTRGITLVQNEPASHPNATPKPPQGLLIANRLRLQSHPNATLMRLQSAYKATPRLQQSCDHAAVVRREHVVPNTEAPLLGMFPVSKN
jgi:hypothetical protein